jgi:probable HAF family extracellular repeat protein
MHRFLLSTVLSLSVLLSTLVAAQDVSYTFTTIDVSSATYTAAHGINAAGQIVGTFDDAAGVRHGFLKDGATFTTFDLPPGPPSARTEPFGINTAGQIVGTFDDGLNHGFLATPARRSQK